MKDILKKKLESSKNPEWLERYEHCLSVTECALNLNDDLKLGLDKEKVYLAAMLHDYAKYDSLDRYLEISEKYSLPNELIKSDKKLHHAFFAPYIIKDELGIDDEEILGAIRYHTTGRSNMSLLEEIVFLADYIEKGRVGKIFNEVRAIAKKI